MLRNIFRKLLTINKSWFDKLKQGLDIVYLKFNQESQIHFSNDHSFQDKFKFKNT